MPVVPTVLGYDARVQLLHEEDAVAVLERAAAGTCPGTFNVGGDGALHALPGDPPAGRVALPMPDARGAARSAGSSAPLGLVDFSPEQMRFLNFGRVVDTTRLRTEFGFTPRCTTVQAFDDYVAGRALRPWIVRRGSGQVQDAAVAVARALPTAVTSHHTLSDHERPRGAVMRRGPRHPVAPGRRPSAARPAPRRASRRDRP